MYVYMWLWIEEVGCLLHVEEFSVPLYLVGWFYMDFYCSKMVIIRYLPSIIYHQKLEKLQVIILSTKKIN